MCVVESKGVMCIQQKPCMYGKKKFFFFFLVNFMENVNKHRLVVVKSIKNIAVNGHRKVPVNTAR